MSNYVANLSSLPNDQRWDAFVASLHRVWQYAPDVSFEGQMNLAGRVVLVIQRDDMESGKLAMQLSKVGLRAYSAQSLTEAYHRVSENEIDVILLFVDSDEASCRAFCEAIHDDCELNATRIIALGESISNEAIWDWRKSGAKFFLRIPYDPYVLLTLMAAALDRD